MLLIIGLGNPGEKYALSRHNFGFLAIDSLQRKISSPLENFSLEKKTNCEIFKKNGFLLAKPQLFMNNSGQAVLDLLHFYKLQIANLVLVHDDFDLPLGKIKLSKGGGAAGHRGVESVIKTLKTSDFLRVRLGIYGGEKKKTSKLKAEQIVLQEFTPKEMGEMKSVLKKFVELIKTLEQSNPNNAMNKFN